MPDVAYKDLCLDANRPGLVGPFWADLIGLSVQDRDGGDQQLTGATPQQTIWINTVSEGLSVKTRVHLDVRLAADDTVVPGSTLLRDRDDDIRWRVLADPDGLAFCAFGPRSGEAAGPFELVVDSVDPGSIAQWWADRTGGTVGRDDGAPWVWIEDAEGFPWRYWVFNPVPERKTVKNRVHWDVSLLDATVEDLVAAGATVLRAQDDEIGWTVMADPEGNEFCAFT